MLEGAERGQRLDYQHLLLPLARTMKACSVVKNVFGGVAQIPEGMSATAALRNKAYTARHARLTAAIAEAAKREQARNGYYPPYWELLQLARRSGL